jgi:SPP1 family predicted phage head-tail adaptor
MQAGKLRHRVTLQSPGGTQDAVGQPGGPWVDFATVWADVRYMNGLEAAKADVPTSVARASIRIRYLAGVVANMRVQHDGKEFDIKAVLPDTTGRRYIDLLAETGVNHG